MIVENIIMAQPVDPSPFTGVFMVGLSDQVIDRDGQIISEGTPCDIGWIYDPVTKTFSQP